MKFEIKNKPNLSDQDIYDGEKHGVSFEEKKLLKKKLIKDLENTKL